MRFFLIPRLMAAATLALLASGLASAAVVLAKGELAHTKMEARLRGAPRPSAQTLATLPAGTTVQLIGFQDYNGRQWEVRTGGKIGWVAEAALVPGPGAEVVDPGAAAGGPPRDASATRARFAALPEKPVMQAPAAGEDRRAELETHWKAIRNGSIDQRAAACQALPYSGHVDPAFFDLLNEWLKIRYEQALDEQLRVDVDVLRCLQGLASSGDLRYLDTVQMWARSPRDLINKYARRYLAQRAPVLMADSAVWNPLINRTDDHVQGQSWATTRVINMIKSGNIILQREGMRRLKRDRVAHAAAFDVLEAQLLKELGSLRDPSRDNSLAWQCRTLAESRNQKYAATLLKAIGGTSSEKLRKHCQRALDALDDPPSDGEDEGERDDGL